MLVLIVPAQPNGSDIAVTLDNVDEYLASVLDILLGKGVAAQAQAFREGFSKVFPVTDLQIFSPDELAMIFGNADEDWSPESAYMSALLAPSF